MEKRDFELYEFGGLNDSKKITATFAHYEVYNGHEGLTISALLNEGELPRTNEGFRTNGQMLWVSLCQLYDKLLLASDEESCEIIIHWCKNHVHPYYFMEIHIMYTIGIRRRTFSIGILPLICWVILLFRCKNLWEIFTICTGIPR